MKIIEETKGLGEYDPKWTDYSIIHTFPIGVRSGAVLKPISFDQALTFQKNLITECSQILALPVC